MAHDARHELGGHTSADDEYLHTPADSTYEHTDISVSIIVKFLFWITASAVVIHVGLGFVFNLLVATTEQAGEARYPLAAPVADGSRLPPEPRLQTLPRNELYDHRLSEESRLHGYAWVDKNAGTVRIPITDAMRMVVERGLPSRPQDPAQPGERPGLMPSDASSGRAVVQRIQ